MSLESALEEERLEILKLLERPSKGSIYQHNSGVSSTPSSPRQHYTSVIPPLYHSRTSSPSRGATTIASLIDIASFPDIGPNPRSTQITWSPTVSKNINGRQRADSGPATNGAPKLLKDRDKPGTQNGVNPTEGYDFSMLPSVVSQGAKRGPHSRDPSIAPSARGSYGRRSLSPGAEELLRSASPRSSSGRLATSPPPVAPRNQITMETGTKIDLDHAYARLNDEALARSGGVLGKLPERRPLIGNNGEHIRVGTGESITSEGGVRLQKDYDSGGERNPAVDSSEDESSSVDSSPESDEDDERRGRAGSRARLRNAAANSPGRDGDNSDKEVGLVRSMIRSVGDSAGGSKKKKLAAIDAKKGTGQMRRISMSLLAAAEEERLLPFSINLNNSEANKYFV